MLRDSVVSTWMRWALCGGHALFVEEYLTGSTVRAPALKRGPCGAVFLDEAVTRTRAIGQERTRGDHGVHGPRTRQRIAHRRVLGFVLPVVGVVGRPTWPTGGPGVARRPRRSRTSKPCQHPEECRLAGCREARLEAGCKSGPRSFASSAFGSRSMTSAQATRGLSRFTLLEPDYVKLDASLIRSIDASPQKRSIVRAMLQLASCDLGVGRRDAPGARRARGARCRDVARVSVRPTKPGLRGTCVVGCPRRRLACATAGGDWGARWARPPVAVDGSAPRAVARVGTWSAACREGRSID